MYLIEYILTRVKKQKLTPSKNSSLWMKNFTKKHLQMEQLPWWWSASLSICSSYKQERYCLEVLTWNLVFWSGPTSLNSFLKHIIYSQLFCYSFAQNFELWVFYSRTQKYCRRKFSTHRKPETTNCLIGSKLHYLSTNDPSDELDLIQADQS